MVCTLAAHASGKNKTCETAVNALWMVALHRDQGVPIKDVKEQVLGATYIFSYTDIEMLRISLSNLEIARIYDMNMSADDIRNKGLAKCPKSSKKSVK